MDVTDRHLSLNSLMKMDETVLHPRNYDGAMFDMLSGTDSVAFRQHLIHGGQPIAQFYSSTKTCTFHGDCSIPKSYNKTSVASLVLNIYTDV